MLARCDAGRRQGGRATLKAEIEALVGKWARASAEQDLAAARRLRADDYQLTLGNGDPVDREGELAGVALPGHRLYSFAVQSVAVEAQGEEAIAHVEVRVAGQFGKTAMDSLFRYRLRCGRRDGRWIILAAEGREVADFLAEQAAAPRRSPVRAALAGARRRLTRLRGKRGPRFQDLAYLPYAPGRDYVLAPHAPARGSGEDLPVPPKDLWLGYDYLAHGAEHVRTMLDIAERSGFRPGDGDRILDLGCGSGRMIRHLAPLTGRCEIWGADISAPHITWCKHNLSPPFRFATTTKVPHLPFEDRSFAFIYCGSLFTHIDDLADAWLLELRRILRPDGRLYVTIHDEETIALFETRRYRDARIVKGIKSSPTYRNAGDDWGMFTIGRDEDSQVFYKRSYFERMAGQAFDMLSVTTEAYHYQTAFLLARKGRPDQ